MANTQNNWLQTAVWRIARVHFFFVLAYTASIVAFDSWNLIPKSEVSQRWTLAALLLIVNTVCWYVSRLALARNLYYQGLAFLLVIADISAAAVTVFAERGMSSRAVALFAVPIIISAVISRSSAVFATAALCTAAYSLAAVRYFTAFPSEGYKIELYGVIAFYSSLFFILAALLSVLIRAKSDLRSQ
jgi:hypothetical protein